MMTTALSLLQSTSAWIWEASWQATVIAALVMITQWTFRRQLAARWRNALWLLVFVRLLMPVLPQARFSAYNWLPEKASVTPTVLKVPEEIPSSSVAAELPEIAKPDHQQPLAATPNMNADRSHQWRSIPALPIAWGTGFLVVLGSGAIGYVRLRRRVIHFQQDVPAILREQFDAAKMELRVCRADLVVSEAVTTPMVTGLWRARIVLPVGLESILPSEDVRMVLLHELAHVKRGDLWMAWLAWIAGALHWFNPAVRYFVGRARKDREMACDEWVLRFISDSHAYGSALVRFLETRQAPTPQLGTIGIFENKSALVQRVKRIASYRRPTVWGSAIGAALLITVGALTLTGASASKPIDHAAKTPTKETNISVTGHLVDEGGEWLKNPSKASVVIESGQFGQMSQSAHVDTDGSFIVNPLAGTLHIAAWMEGRAPAFPASLKAKNDIKDFDIVMPNGFPTVVHVTAENGKPVEGAQIKGYYVGPPRIGEIVGVTNANGDAAIASVGRSEIALEVAAKGFVAAHLTGIHFDARKPQRCVLIKGHPMVGRVIEAETGKPLPNAVIKLAGVTGSYSECHYPDSAPVLATTDEHGDFSLDPLANDSIYRFFVEAGDRRSVVSRDAGAGNAPIEIKLGPPLVISGKILTSVVVQNIRITCQQTLEVGKNKEGTSTTCMSPVTEMVATVENGVARFKFTKLYPAQTEIVAGQASRNEKTLRLDHFRESLDNVTIDMDLASNVTPARSEEATDKTWPIERVSQPFIVRCEDEEGHAVPNAEVYLLQWHGTVHQQNNEAIPFTSTGPVRTDASGKVEFANPITFHHGDYRRLVYTRVPGKLVAGRFVDRITGSNTNDSGESSITIKMLPSITLHGKVQLVGGRDPRLATVSLMWNVQNDSDNAFGGLRRMFGQPEPWPELVERKPNRDGTFAFQDIPQKSLVHLAANAPGFGETQQMKSIPLSGSEPLTMLLEPESIIKGQVCYAPSGKPAAGIRVYARARSYYFATTLANGAFQIGGLSEGAYDVSAERSADWTVQPQNVTTRPEASGSANLVMEQGVTVAGKVTEQVSLAPVKGITISAVSGGIEGRGQELDSAVTDASGVYRLRLPSGKSRLYIAAFESKDFEDPKDQARRTITIADGKITEGSPDFVLTRKKTASPEAPIADATVHGRVLDPAGKPMPNVLISYDTQPLPKDPNASGNQTSGPMGFTKEDGTYEFKVHPFCDYEIRAGGVLHSTARSRRFETGSGTSHQVEDLAIRPALSSAAGIVVDQDGRTVANVEIEPTSKNKFAWRENTVRTDEEGRFHISHLLGDEPFDLWLYKPGYTPRQLYAIPPDVTDLRVLLPRETQTMPQRSFTKWLRDGKRLIGQPAPAWDVQEWIQKQDPTPDPKRSDGRWTLLWFERGEDGSGEYIQRVAQMAHRFNLAPVVIYQSHFDAHLPRWILQKTPLPVTVGVDRFTNDPANDPQQSEHSVTRIAYGNRNAYLIDPDGIVRATPNNNLEGIGAVMGKPER